MYDDIPGLGDTFVAIGIARDNVTQLVPASIELLSCGFDLLHYSL
jgi:hypothetical protein